MIEQGRYRVLVGPDSRTFPLRGAVRLAQARLAT